MPEERATPPPAQPGDEFLSGLKALGYLNNPLDKYFIGGPHGRTGFIQANLKVAVKVGILGGIFLGVVAAFGLALLAPETYAGASTTARLALYFSALFTVFFTLLELVICLAVSVLGRLSRRLFTRTQMIALYSGVFAGLATIVYGTLWWWTGAAEGELVSGRSIAVLAVMIALAAFVAVITRLGVTALLALMGGADLTARGKGRATALYVVVLVAAAGFFMGYRIVTAPEVQTEPSPYERVETGLSVTLVAIDGVTAPMGDYANLGAFLDRAGVFTLAPPEIPASAAVWTTVATGVSPQKHGVTSCSAQEVPGLGIYVRDGVGVGFYDALISALPSIGLSRRAPLIRGTLSYPSVWDIIARKGDLSGVVNWWGTWPAEDFHGFLVSDRMYPKLQISQALSKKPDFEYEASPKWVFDRLSAYPAASGKAATGDTMPEDIDSFAIAAFAEASRDYERVALGAIYLPGLDIHETRKGITTSAEYLRALDAALKPLLDRASPSHVVILVTDPGMTGQRIAASGVFAMAGGPVVKRSGKSGRLTDVAPTILCLLGFPVSEEMDGRVLLDAFSTEFVAAHKPAAVKSFGRLRTGKVGEYSIDSEIVDRLRSLGYLQ
jgi:hypothetical protein